MQAAGVPARLSPQTNWERNITQANEIYHHLPEEAVAGLFHDKREPLQSGRADAPDQPMRLNRQPSRSIIHAHAIATGKESPEENIPTGSNRVKVGSFYNNIAQPDTSPHTTVDFRARDIAAAGNATRAAIRCSRKRISGQLT